MMTLNDKLRLRARSAEFAMPLGIHRSLVRLQLGLADPYVPGDDQHRAVFVHIPKAAGTSIRTALYGTKSFHIPAIRYQSADPEKFSSYFKFCFVRNPWSRLKSAYHYLYRSHDKDMAFPDHRWAASNLRKYPTFESFVLALEDPKIQKNICRYIHFRDQLDWVSVAGAQRTVLMDYVGRYETLDHDYDHIMQKLGVSAKLPVARAGQYTDDYRAAYTTKMTDIAASIYKADISAFGYEFE